MLAQMANTKIVAYAEQGKSVAIGVAASVHMHLYNVRAWNRSGGAANVGICRKLKAGAGQYKVFTKVASAYTDVTSALEAGTATGIATLTNNDGIVVQAKRQFGLFGFTVSNAAANGTYAVQYYNGAWTTLPCEEKPTNLGTTGDKYIVFIPPSDWVAGDGSATAIDQSMYAIRLIHTTAPDDTGSANAVWFGELLEYFEGVADNSGVQVMFSDERPFVLDAGEGIFPYFSTANAANYFAAFYGSG